MRLRSSVLFASVLSTASADFLMSNTSVCMGTFIVQQCYHGVAVLSGVDKDSGFDCGKLVHAEDNNYIRNGTAGPFGSQYVNAEGGVCGSGQLNFVKDGEKYTVFDKNNNNVGDCHWDNSTTTQCNQWVGMLYFGSMYRCTSSVCS